MVFPRTLLDYRRSASTNYITLESTSSITSSSSLNCPIKSVIQSALALTLALHDEGSHYSYDVDVGRIEGHVEEAQTIEGLLIDVNNVRDLSTKEVSMVQLRISGQEKELMDVGDYSFALRANLGTAGLTSFKLSFDPLLMTKKDANWFLSHLQTAFNGLLRASSSNLCSEIAFMNDQELEIITTFTTSPPPPSGYPLTCTTLPSFILHAAQYSPKSIALVFDSTIYTYEKLIHLATLFAHRLLELGVKKGSIVPLCISKSAEMIFSMLGILLAGAGYLCLEPSLPMARQEGILRDLEEKGLLAPVGVVQEEQLPFWRDWMLFGDTLVDPIAFFQSHLTTVSSLSSNSPPLPKLAESDPAYVIFTSGSTGKSKGIMISHSNVSAFLRNYRGVFGRAPGERVLQFSSYSFDVSVVSIWDTLAVSPPFFI